LTYYKPVVDCDMNKVEVGTIVKWSVADGYAHYRVLEVAELICYMEHLPEGDGYESPVVVDGIALTAAVQKAVDNDLWYQSLVR